MHAMLELGVPLDRASAQSAGLGRRAISQHLLARFALLARTVVAGQGFVKLAKPANGATRG